MKKKSEEAKEEAERALEEYEEWENSGGAENPKKSVYVSGRRVFGATAKVEVPKESKKESDNFYDNSDSDNDMDGIKDNDLEAVSHNDSPARNTGTMTETEVSCFSSLFNHNGSFFSPFQISHNNFFCLICLQKFDDVPGNPASKTTFDVALYASGSWKKVCFEFF